MKKVRSNPTILYRKALSLFKSTPEEQGKVFDLFEQAMNLGSIDATYAVATWYLHGRHVALDVKKAIVLLKRAAKGGSSSACFDLAYSFEVGVGGVKNTEKAFELYLESALRGDAQACHEVARCYWHGIGTKKNRTIAHLWGNLEQEKVLKFK